MCDTAEAILNTISYCGGQKEACTQLNYGLIFTHLTLKFPLYACERIFRVCNQVGG